MADDKVKIDIRRVRKEPTIYEKNSLYLISDIGEENFVLIVTDPEGNPKKIEVEELIEYAKLTDLPETSTLQELLDTVPEDIGKLQTPLRLNEWADSKYALKNHTHIWGDITDRPTKLTDFQNDLENYGNWITENFADNKYALRIRSITGEGSLEGGGDLTQDRTIDLKDETKTYIGLGVEAHGWGDHKTEGYLKDSDLDGYATEDWVEGKGYITSYEDTTYTAGEGLDLDEGEFSITQSALDALGEAHTHDNKDVLDEISSEDVDNWDEAYAKSHIHDNKTLLDSLDQDDLDEWNEAYTKSHEHSNKTTLDGITDSDIANWNSKIDEIFADSKYALRETKVSAGSGLTGGGNLTQDLTIGLSSGTLSDIGKGVEAHSYTLDDVAKNDNTTTVKLVGDSVFSNTEAEDYAQMEDLWKAGWSIQYLASEFKLVLRRRDDFIISEVDLSSLVSGDLSITIDDTDPNDPEIVFTQDGVEVGRVPASALLTGVVNSGELVGEQLHFKDRTGTTVINIDLSPVLEVKAEKTTTINAGTGLSGGGTLASNRTIDFDTSWGDDRYQRVLTAGDNISISGNEISATDTKYSAGNGLTLSGTTFSLPVSVTGSGTFVKGVTQGTNGINIELGTPPNTNTTYSNMTLTELNAGTVTTARSISAKTLTDWGNGKYALRTRTISAGNGLTGGGNLTANRTISLSTDTQEDIAKGVEAHGWGDFRDYGLGVISGLTTMNQSNQHNSLANSWFRVTSTTYSDFLSAGTGISLSYSQDYSNQLFIAHVGNRKGIWYRSKVLGESEFETPIRVWDDFNLPNPATETWVNNQGFLKSNALNNYYTKNEADGRFALRTRTITAGTGLTGGGSLTANRTLTIAANQVPQTASSLGSTNLDTINTSDKCGFYYQSSSANATSARGYPTTTAGNLRVYRDAGIVQIYNVYNTARTWRRHYYNSVWSSWVRTDVGFLTAGTNVSISSTGVISAVNTNTTYSVFTRSVNGLVPRPTTTTTTRYLREDGTWVVPPNSNTTYSTGTLAQLNAGTDTTGRLQTAKLLNDWLNGKANATGTVANSLVRRDGLKINTSGGFFETSDRRLKTSIKDIGDTLNKVLNIPTVSYNMNKQDSIGTIAQDVQEIFPELVNTDEDGMLSVNYAKLSIVAIKAIKELKEELNEVERLINE